MLRPTTKGSPENDPFASTLVVDSSNAVPSIKLNSLIMILFRSISSRMSILNIQSNGT